MEIRAARTADIPALVAMGMRFATSDAYKDLLGGTPACIQRLVERVMADPGSAALVADSDGVLVGMMGLTSYVQPMSGELIATEIVWWVDLDRRGSTAGLRLLKAAEAWARGMGATRLQMIAPTDHVAQFYERVGFTRVEIHYQRTLS